MYYSRLRSTIYKNSVRDLIEALQELQTYEEQFQNDSYISKQIEDIPQLIEEVEVAVEHLIEVSTIIEEYIANNEEGLP